MVKWVISILLILTKQGNVEENVILLLWENKNG